MRLPLRKIGSLVCPRPSRLLRELNSNALMNQWLAGHRADRRFADRFALYESINAEVIRGEAIDYLEFGVWRGESLLKWAALNARPESRFTGFDTFEGLPETWDGVRESAPARTFATLGRTPETSDPRVRFVKGLFQETLGPFLQDHATAGRLVVHNDSDLYTSSLYCLTMLDARLVPGSILIFDEFYSSSHEFQAFHDYTTSYRRRYRVLGAVGEGEGPYVQVAFLME